MLRSHSSSTLLHARLVAVSEAFHARGCARRNALLRAFLLADLLVNPGN